MTTPDVRELAREHGFGEIADELAALAAPALMLREGEQHAGRLGGVPRLPPGTPWPLSRWTTMAPEPLTFIAELDLAALDPSIWPGPREGTLSVFCHVNAEALYVDSGGAPLVLHHPPGTVLEPVAIPDELDPDLRYAERHVAAVAATTLPWIGAQELTPLGIDDARSDAYGWLALAVAGAEGSRTPDQLLGWPLQIQEDLAELWPRLHEEAVGHGLSSGVVADDEWRLLLQTGAADDMAFGDGGSLYFAIPAGDLAAGRFDRVQAVTDSA